MVNVLTVDILVAKDTQLMLYIIKILIIRVFIKKLKIDLLNKFVLRYQKTYSSLN